MTYQILQYLKFLYRSTNHHRVHSPFIYKFVTECLYDRRHYREYSIIESYRNELLSNHSQICIEDLGAGSRMAQGMKRTVSQVAKNSGSSGKQSKLLFRLTNYYKPNKILELGTSLGISTLSMALGNQISNITTVEGSESLSLLAESKLKNEYPQIIFRTNSFTAEIPNIKNEKWDMIFIDGDHSKEGTLYYFEQLLESVHNDAIMIFDDIYWSKGMTSAWEIIKKNPHVTVTVDTFFKGFVFFRKEQAKENFVIRI